MNSARKVLNETRRQHQEVADFTISLPQNLEVCTLHVRIRAASIAGVSTAVTSTESGSEGNRQQGNSTTIIGEV